MADTRLILASGSPRRQELLRSLGIEFDVRPADVDETPFPDEDPVDYVARLATTKAMVAAGVGELVLAADTTVTLDGRILGKPTDADDAIAMLHLLRGRTHQVHTGVALQHGDGGELRVEVDTAEVVMDDVSSDVIAWYVSTGEPMDKAGSYGLQGIGGMLVSEIRGNPQTVIGLPMTIVRDWLWRHRPNVSQ